MRKQMTFSKHSCTCAWRQYGKKPEGGESGGAKGKGGKSKDSGDAGDERSSSYKFRGLTDGKLRKGGKLSHHAFKSKSKHKRRK